MRVSDGSLRVVVFQDAAIDVIAGANVKTPFGVFEDVHKKGTTIRAFQARQVGLEPTTSRLTAGCSTIELLPNFSHLSNHNRSIPTCRDSTIELLPNFSHESGLYIRATAAFLRCKPRFLDLIPKLSLYR